MAPDERCYRAFVIVILRNLPKLPEGVEYRIIGRNLILRDVKANMIVDYIPNAIR